MRRQGRQTCRPHATHGGLRRRHPSGRPDLVVEDRCRYRCVCGPEVRRRGEVLGLPIGRHEAAGWNRGKLGVVVLHGVQASRLLMRKNLQLAVHAVKCRTVGSSALRAPVELDPKIQRTAFDGWKDPVVDCAGVL